MVGLEWWEILRLGLGDTVGIFVAFLAKIQFLNSTFATEKKAT